MGGGCAGGPGGHEGPMLALTTTLLLILSMLVSESAPSAEVRAVVGMGAGPASDAQPLHVRTPPPINTCLIGAVIQGHLPLAMKSDDITVQAPHPMIMGYGNTLIYAQPKRQLNVSKRVFANPAPWPHRNLTTKTASVLWQHGDDGGCALQTPFDKDLSTWTGVIASPVQQASVASRVTKMPWSAVQFTVDGTWGAAMNTTGADPEVEPLTTTTLESSWADPATPESCIPVFSGGGFTVDLQLAVPRAFRLARSASTARAVYVSLSVYLRSMPFGSKRSHFIWYSTKFFDYQRDIFGWNGDNVFVDKSSNKLIISSPVATQSAYNTRGTASALSSNESWSEKRHFQYTVTAEHVEQGIHDGLKKFSVHFVNQSLRLPPKASSYCISGYNLELEATPGAGAGLSASGITITRHLATPSNGS
eukprot:COSAG02_NODE_121_length_35326_cov_25.450819_33_plen_420_part_00